MERHRWNSFGVTSNRGFAAGELTDPIRRFSLHQAPEVNVKLRSGVARPRDRKVARLVGELTEGDRIGRAGSRGKRYAPSFFMIARQCDRQCDLSVAGLDNFGCIEAVTANHGQAWRWSPW